MPYKTYKNGFEFDSEGGLQVQAPPDPLPLLHHHHHQGLDYGLRGPLRGLAKEAPTKLKDIEIAYYY